MKGSQARFISYCLAIGLIVLTMVMPTFCSCSSKSTKTVTRTSLTTSATTTLAPLSISTSSIIPATTTSSTSSSQNGEQTSGLLSSGASVQGELTFSGEVNWYTFTVESTDVVHIVLTKGTDDSGVFPWLELIAPDGSVVFDSYDVEIGGHATGNPINRAGT